jgi:hypothetical protein
MKFEKNASDTLVVRHDLLNKDAKAEADAIKLRNRILGITETSLTQHFKWVIDRSGSMYGKEEEVRNTFRRLIDTTKDITSVEHDILLFNDNLERVSSMESYKCSAMTALYQAIEQASLIAENEVAHNHVTIYVLTDGEDTEGHDNIPALLRYIEEKKKLGWRYILIKFDSLRIQSDLDDVFEVTTTSDLSKLIEETQTVIMGQLTGKQLMLPHNL